MKAIDQVFSSFITPTFLCTLAIVFFAILMVFRWEIVFFLEDYVLPACARFLKAEEAFKTRHIRLITFIDKVVIGPFVIVSFALSVMFHRWVLVLAWGIQTWLFWERLKARRRSVPDDAELHQRLVEVESDIKARGRE
jgi:predicted membrane protein